MAGPVSYFLEDWMKRSFVSCKYYDTQELLNKPARIVTKVLNLFRSSFFKFNHESTSSHWASVLSGFALLHDPSRFRMIYEHRNYTAFPNYSQNSTHERHLPLHCRRFLEMGRQLFGCGFPLPGSQMGINALQHFRHITENLGRLPEGPSAAGPRQTLSAPRGTPPPRSLPPKRDGWETPP